MCVYLLYRPYDFSLPYIIIMLKHCCVISLLSPQQMVCSWKSNVWYDVTEYKNCNQATRHLVHSLLVGPADLHLVSLYFTVTVCQTLYQRVVVEANLIIN